MTALFVVAFIILALIVGMFTMACRWLVMRLVSPERQRNYIIVGVFVIITSLSCVYLANSIYYFGPDELGVVIRHFGKELPANRNIALDGEAGRTDWMLSPGYHIGVLPFIYSVERGVITNIPKGKIGIVYAKDGIMPQSDEETLVTEWERDENWMDSKYFLGSSKGYRGIQNPPLANGSYRLHPSLFESVIVDTTLHNIRFGAGIKNDTSDGPGRGNEITVNVQGVTVDVHMWVRYQVKPDAASTVLTRLGTINPDAEAKETVQSATRIVVRKVLAGKQAADLDERREEISNMIKENLVSELESSGIHIDFVGLTSLYFDDRPDGIYNQIQEQRSLVQLNQQKIKAMQSHKELLKAISGKEAFEDENKKQRMFREAKMVSESESINDERELIKIQKLASVVGGDNASMLLSIEKAMKAGIDIFPEVVTSGEIGVMQVTPSVAK